MAHLPQSHGANTFDEEVRVAMALNGGVSLAVWMGGCAVELDCARRAHLGAEDLGYDKYEPDGASGTATRRVYHSLCKAFGRKFSVDILAGASAGGVNGALLGAAMVSGRRLHPRFVRERWLDLGDLALLLRDPTAKDPPSLMDGGLFRAELLRAFLAVKGESKPGGGKPDAVELAALAAGRLPTGQRRLDEGRLVPDLDVTMTDVVGTPRSFPDEWGHELFAREYAPRFKFRREGDFSAPALADAARTSASFPVAFEPWKVDGEAAARAGLPGPTYGIDGGVLDNAPIRAALELIPFRRAGTRVQRYACYLNADPAQPEPSGEHGRPEVEDVIGYVVSLPRTAPFVDQLYAVRAAVNRPQVTQAIVRELLEMDLRALEETAKALLPAYKRRRTMRSIDELVPDPVRARALRKAMPDDGGPLPWIPDGEEIKPPEPEQWDWGVRPAQRILYLLLDLLRDELNGAPAQRARALLELRGNIDARIERLEHTHRLLNGLLRRLLAAPEDPPADAEAEAEELASAIADAARIAAARAPLIYRLVEEAAYEVLRFRLRTEAEGEPAPGEAFGVLFDPVEEEEKYEPIEIFFRRVLAIEVVRRALADEVEIDTAQELSFVQLTPSAPTPILARKPLTEPPPAAEAKDKLTGVGLAHFAGFYRRAWRANDFMWGRLDGAARVVDLLLDRPPEPEEDAENFNKRQKARAKTIVEGVLGAGASAEQRWLVQEALADRGVAPEPNGELLDAAELTARLTDAIFDELAGGGRSPRVTELPLTRAVCARAAQLEAIRDELPVLIEEAKTDGERGSSGKPLDLGEGGLRSQIEALRGVPPLPQRLIGKGEEVSDLGLGTIARAGRVGISMLQSTQAPLTKVLGVVRVPALAVSGVVARERLSRLTAVCGFSAAAIYLSSRIVTAKPTTPPFSDLWSLSVLLSLVGALVVAAAIAVPVLQAWKGIARPLNAARALGLFACGGVLVGLFALWAKGGGLSLEQVLLCPGADDPPQEILILALVATAGLSMLRLPVLGGPVNRLLLWPPGRKALCGVLIAVSLAVAIAAGIALWGQIGGGWWRTAGVLLALPGAPLAAAIYLMPWKRRGPAKKEDAVAEARAAS